MSSRKVWQLPSSVRSPARPRPHSCVGGRTTHPDPAWHSCHPLINTSNAIKIESIFTILLWKLFNMRNLFNLQLL